MKKTVIVRGMLIVIVLVLVLTPILYGGAVVRSKSNIANNRVVLGSTLGQPNAPEGGHVVIMDADTGEIWRYSAKALAGNASPQYVSTIETIGQRAIRDERYATTQ